LAPFVIEKSAGLALDYDLLGRYFNGTSMGINFIADKARGRDGVAASKFHDEEALAQIFVTHFGFLANCKSWRDALSHEDFLCFCRTLGAHDGAKASRASVRYAARRLRIGALLHHGLDEQNLYHYDYDHETISGSFVSPQSGEAMTKQQSITAQDTYGSSEELTDKTHEYLFSNPQDWPGNVHWVHAHKPTRSMVLALGQQHRLRIHAQGLLCRLQAVYPQHNFHHALQGSGSTDWFLMTFPAVVLDGPAQQSLDNFKKWKARRKKMDNFKEEPPPVHVGVVSYPAALLWTAPGGHDTVLSVTGDAEYVGKWTNSVAPSGKPLASWLHSISCCQRRKLKQDDYEELPQEEEDVEKSFHQARSLRRRESRFMDKISLQVAEAEAGEEGSFEHTFQSVLLLLAEGNSLLRMGTHVQLACRILLFWTSAHVEVVHLYEAAITRINHQLAQKDHPDKEILIGKVANAKLEISTLQRRLDPFVKYVLPEFHAHLSEGPQERKGDLSQVIRTHHLVDIENNLRQTMQALESRKNLCESIIGEYDRKSADRVNNVLNFLTIITFLVMPVQILTGVYGMNFAEMPELNWKYGYPYFFVCASFVFTLVFATFLCVYRSMI